MDSREKRYQATNHVPSLPTVWQSMAGTLAIFVVFAVLSQPTLHDQVQMGLIVVGVLGLVALPYAPFMKRKIG